MRTSFATPSSTQLVLLVAVSTVSWSFGPICIRYALQYDVPPEIIAFGRMLIGALVFTPFAWQSHRQDIRDMPRRSRLLAIGSGAMFGFNITLHAASLQHISVIIGQALIATIPIWVAVLEARVLKARLSRPIWVGVTLALIGGITISLATTGEPPALEDGNPSLGLVFALVGAFAASLYIIIGRSLRGSVSFIPYIWLVYASATLTSMLIITVGQKPVFGYDPMGYFWVVLLGILSQVVGHGVLNFVLKFISPTTLTVVSQAVPVLGAVWALIILREVPTGLQVAGSVVLVTGVGVVLHAQNRVKRPTSRIRQKSAHLE